MSNDRRITISERFGTVKFRERGAVSISPRFTGPVRFAQQAVEISERVLSQPIRFVGQEYPPFVEPLVISNFQWVQIGRNSATVSYVTNRDTKCKIYTRRETPLGSWAYRDYPTFHATHPNHVTVALLALNWYHLYVLAEDVGGIQDYEPDVGWYYRFKTAGPIDPGIIDPNQHHD